MDTVWDGITHVDQLQEDEARARNEIADAAKGYDWPALLKLLSVRPDLVNTSRPSGTSRYAPLHQAAHGGAPINVVEQLINLSAWRTLQNFRGGEGDRYC